jgi:catechol 2,3-dioxygenase-like lactoylglutathione lyase family enzyme
MKAQTFTSPSDPTKTRVALVFGDQKINLHEKDMQVTPLAQHPRPGSTDLCLWTDQPVADYILPHWLAMGGDPLKLENENYVVQRTGANGPLTSVYIYDPDGNLIEVANRSY